jgi:hypothetical protein
MYGKNNMKNTYREFWQASLRGERQGLENNIKMVRGKESDSMHHSII